MLEGGKIVLDKYIKINERVIISGQTSGGVWYCKELPAETTKEADDLIGKMNAIYNKYNKKVKEDKKTKEDKKI